MAETYGANFETSDVLRMFPSFVWKAQMAPSIRQGIEDDVLSKLDEMRRDAGEPAPGRGWQSEQDLHHLEEFRGLVARIHDAVESVLEFLKIEVGAFEITGLWANMNPKGAAHPVHSHPNNFLSGVYYPRCLMERYFDLFLYLANWGTRRLSIRLPARLIDVQTLERFCPDDGVANVRTAGAHAIIDIWRDEIDQDDWDDGGGWLAALAPLRGDIMQGDLRAFYLIWLIAVEDGQIGDEAKEPLTGIAPLSAPLRAFADFFGIDPDLVDAAAAKGAPPPPEAERAAAETFIRSLPEEDKVALLLRLHDGDAHLGAELRQRRLAAAGRRPDTGGGRRSAGELRETARRMGAERHRLAAEKVAAECRRREAEQAQARNRHLVLLAERGAAPWRDVEELISRRNQPGYERAVTLMIDLGEVARSRGEEEAFARRLADIRARHDRKGRLIERLDAADLR